MADIIPICDSDEEVFFGPVTAREIELMWRSKLQKKNERNTEVNITDSRVSVSCEQLVPSLELVAPVESPVLKESQANIVAYDSSNSRLDKSDTSKNLISSVSGENKSNSFSVHETLNFIDEDEEMDVILDKENSAPLSNNAHFESHINSSIQVIQNKNALESHCNVHLSTNAPGHDEHEKLPEEKATSEPPSLSKPNDTKIIEGLIPKDFVDEIPFEKTLVSIRKENGFEVFIPITPNHNEKFYNETISSVHSKVFCNETVMSEINMTDYCNDKKQMSFCTINDDSHFIFASATETKQISATHVSPESKNIDNPDFKASKEAEQNVIDSSCVHDNNLESQGCQVTEISLNYSESVYNHVCSIVEHSSSRAGCTRSEISPSENVDLKAEDPKPADEVQDIELKIENLDLGKLNAEKKEIIINKDTENKSDSESDENDKSFVSLPPSEEINSESKEGDCSYVPPDKKQCFQSTSQTDKENEDPKSRIPVPGGRIPVLTANIFKTSVLKPPILKAENVSKNIVWVPSFKKKKIPPPKKPNYIVSPNKLGSLLKSTPVDKLNRPKSAEVSSVKTPLAPQHSNNHQRTVSRSDSKLRPQSALKSKLLTPPKLNRQGNGKVNTPLKNPMYGNVVSPVAEYIKNRTTIIRNVTPSGNFPNITPKKVQDPVISTPKIAASPKGSLPPKYYSSAEKRLVLEAHGTKASYLPKLGERQAAVYNTSPKYRVLKNIGRIRLEETDGAKVMESVERQAKTSLGETSFAHLPPAAGMEFEVSVLQEQ